MKAYYSKHMLDFKIPGGTSRGVLTQKETWYLIILDKDQFGIGECAMFRGLSIDDRNEFEATLLWVCEHIALPIETLRAELIEFPSILFGLEQAVLSLQSQTAYELFPSPFTQGIKAIPINGLVWMGTPEFMKQQIREKIASGFTCIKIKIGALDFNEELLLLKMVREEYGDAITLRLDANGAFSSEAAEEKLLRLSEFDIHSIEQPIAPGQWDLLRLLGENTPIPIALDEELISLITFEEKERMIKIAQPQYLILKPSLLGGYKACEEWINLAQSNSAGWWVTSALESNIGLNAIAQWTYQLHPEIPQGLGTGGVFTNNIESPLTVKSGMLHYEPSLKWNSNLIEELCI